MTDKQQIEEMASVLREILYRLYHGIEADNIPLREVSKELLKRYQPKIPEGTMVLTTEEFWKLSNKFSKKELDEIVEFHKNKTRKETAKEILTKWFNSDLCETGGYCVPYIRELAKQYGVEVS